MIFWKDRKIAGIVFQQKKVKFEIHLLNACKLD